MEKHKLIIDEDLQDLVPGYIESRRSELSNIDDKLKGNDFKYLREMAHDWHGTGASYGIPIISEIGEKLSKAAKAENKAEIQRLGEQLKKYLERVDISYD